MGTSLSRLRHRAFGRAAVIAGAAACLLAGWACTEQLPAYEDPTDLFEPSIRAALVYRSDAIAIDVRYVLVNRFDETLDDVVDITGWLTVALDGVDSTVRTYLLSPTQLAARSYSASTRRLTVDPGDSVAFLIRYDFFDDTGRQLTGEMMRWRSDLSCDRRLLSERTSFVIRASVKLFPRTAASVAEPLVVSWCIPMPWVSDKDCPGAIRPGECP